MEKMNLDKYNNVVQIQMLYHTKMNFYHASVEQQNQHSARMIVPQTTEAMEPCKLIDLMAMIKTGKGMFPEWLIDKPFPLKLHHRTKIKICLLKVLGCSIKKNQLSLKNKLYSKTKICSIKYGKIRECFRTANFQI